MAPSGKNKISEEERKRIQRERKRKQRALYTDDQKQKISERRKVYNQTKRKKIADLNPREQRKVRRQTKERCRKHRQKRKEQKGDAPTADDTNATKATVSPSTSRQFRAGEKIRKEGRQQLILENKILKQKNDVLMKQLKALKKSFNRMNAKEVPTPEKKLNALLPPAVSRSISNPVKRRLIYNEMIVNNLQQKGSELVKADEKEFFKKIVTPPKLEKYYKLVREHRSTIMSYKQYSRFRVNIRRKIGKSGLPKSIVAKVVNFYEQDDVSRMCAGKKETRTRKKVKKQMRILNDSCKNLHKRFVAETGVKISRSSFVRLKPYWVCFPKVEKREMCLCVLCANFKNIATPLVKRKLLPTANLAGETGLLKLICCDKNKRECMYGECGYCPNKLEITLQNEVPMDDVKFFQWVNVKEKVIIKGKEKEIKKVEKKMFNVPLQDLVSVFFEKLGVIKQHVYDIHHQYRAIKDLKENLSAREVMYHIDFSENYSLKFSEEIQSMHFGASRAQISLHTGLIYHREEKGPLLVNSFATMSENLDHKSYAIVAHMRPIWQLTKELKRAEDIEVVHFLSDSPSSQYRNQYTIHYIAEELKHQFPSLKGFVWNYSISGHGKGAADGIGGTLKRTADSCVAQGRDIGDVSQLYESLSNSCPGITLYHVGHEDIEAAAAELKTVQTKALPRVMKTHQIIWNGGGFKLRSLSSYPVKIVPPLRVEDVYSSSQEENSSQHEDLEDLTLKEGDWIIVRYDELEYPGEILQVFGDCVVVSTMEPCGVGGLFKWPAKADILSYPNSDIVRKIDAPTPAGNRGQFHFNKNLF